MVAEPWILKMGNQVSNNFKNTLPLDNSRNLKKQGQKSHQEKHVIGILSFEVANVMSKVIQLHKSLTDNEISRLKNEIFKCVGIRTLVCDDEKQLLELALVEKLDDLNRVASAVSRLGKKCTVPALQGFEHVYGDVVSGVIDVKELGFLVKDMEGMMRKMEKYISSTASLYNEIQVLNELEEATKKFQMNQHEESRKAFEQKVVWQKQDVRHLKDISLWNQIYDKVVELLARTVCTIYARILVVFAVGTLRKEYLSGSVSGMQIGSSGILHHVKQEFRQKSGQIAPEIKSCMSADSMKRVLSTTNSEYLSGPIGRMVPAKRDTSTRTQVAPQRSEGRLFAPEDFNFPCGMGPRRMFMECLSLSSTASKVDDDEDFGDDERGSQISGCGSVPSGLDREQNDLSSFFGPSIDEVASSGNHNHMQFKGGAPNQAKFGPKSRVTVYAPPSTVGGSALALHYANVIIVIEKLLRYPHLVGEEARDDLYQMLPTSLRKTLKTNLRSYMKSLAIYDAPLAHDWKGKLDEMLKWFAPLAHNMIRWQSERSFEQQQVVKRTNVLLLQTLYFADRAKTEAAICELLVGLNYICRYEQQQNALLDCASSFDFEECMEWQMQYRASFHSD